jgi:hypothetical protein
VDAGDRSWRSGNKTGPTLTVFRNQPDGGWVIARDANLLIAD